MSALISPPTQDIVEISTAPDLYLVEFTFGQQPNNRISIILPATCGLAAMTRAWELFPEYRRGAVHTHVHAIQYAEIDWLHGRTIIMKQKPEAHIPIFKIEEPNTPRKRK